ncbi:MAG: radical family heme chaperone HemW [Bacteroidota bacterium]|jgi:oxygen-independent coproporphyrinogen-3 oxidase
MAGIYFHIPYCRKACHYCDFHFSTSAGTLGEMVDALIAELAFREDLPSSTPVGTIYFGGGTPSMLPPSDLSRLLVAVHDKFPVDPAAEITLEANPDDLDERSLAAWKEAGINRLSIGIQSFRNEDLQYMNRSHSAEDALAAVERARSAGFRDLTIDLIYGTPTMDDAAWESNLEMLGQLKLPHFSAYALTVEPRTALAAFVRSGTSPFPEEEQAARQFNRLLEWSGRNGYEQYEISNFSLPGRHSRHNTAYWSGVPYLGIGPSAHSFDGIRRSWNVRSNPEYIRQIKQGIRPYEEEILTPEQRYNEHVLTGLRTSLGINHELLLRLFGEESLKHFRSSAKQFVAKGWMQETSERTVLTDAGKLFADHIAAELFR